MKVAVRHDTIGNLCCWKKDRLRIAAEIAQERGTAPYVESLDVDAPTNPVVIVGADDAVSKGISIAYERNGLNRDTDALVFL